MAQGIILLFTLFLFIPYSSILLLYRKWFKQLKPFIITKEQPSTFFSIIIPARNEEENIGKCLQSIVQQNYPTTLFEIIVMNDHSTDHTVAVVNSFSSKYLNIQVIDLETILGNEILNAYKKKAIEIGIGKAKGEWIITTDADCVLKPKWLKNYDAFIQQNNPVFIAAPVVFSNNGTLLNQFQYIDFMALQAATAASVSAGVHNLCNGANLAYKKSVFNAVHGFKGIDNVASGDDMLLMQKIKNAYPNDIGYLFSKEAIASTNPMPDLKSFINQRVRWASKTSSYKDNKILMVLFSVYLMNVFLFFMPLMVFIHLNWLIFWFTFILLKTIVEWRLMQPASEFFGSISFLWFTVLQPLHIAYTVIAGWLGLFGKYQWKDRKVN